MLYVLFIVRKWVNGCFDNSKLYWNPFKTYKTTNTKYLQLHMYITLIHVVENRCKGNIIWFQQTIMMNIHMNIRILLCFARIKTNTANILFSG